MKITIIGAGNIGSAVAACLAKGHLYNEKILSFLPLIQTS